MAKIPSITELKAMTIEDLRGDLENTKHELTRVRMGIVLNKEKNTSRQRTLRRHVAQILTVLAAKHPSTPKSSKKPLSEAKKANTLPKKS